jgi:multidrug resistance efflux pump
MLRKLWLPLASLLLVGWAVWNVFAVQKDNRTAPAPVAPARSPFTRGVAGAGMVEANTMASGTGNIAVGTDLAGTVREVLVKEVGQHFEKGDPLFRLDDRALQAQLKVNQANLEAARAQVDKDKLGTRPEDLKAQDDQVRQLQNALVGAQDALVRAQMAGSATAAGDLATLQTALDVAKAQLAQAQAVDAKLKAGTWAPDLAIDQAKVDQAQAQLNQTQTDLDRLTVKAPVSGEVLQMNVRPGESVTPQPGQALILMGDTSTLLVRVSIDESDMPRLQPFLKPGGVARAYNRGEPQHEYQLNFVRVEPAVVPKTSLTGDNAERVDTRVLQVIYAVQKPSAPLYVGNLLDVFIDAAA